MSKTTRNPQDATRRNVQAANKRIVGLEKRIRALEAQMARLLKSGVASMAGGR